VEQYFTILFQVRVHSTFSKPSQCPTLHCSALSTSGSPQCLPVLYVKPVLVPSHCVVMMQCPIDTWSAGGANVPCTQCPANTASPSTSTNIDACVCLPGYKPGASGCVQCVSGEVCPGGTSVGEVVIECPPGAISPPGSDSPAACVCQAGYGKLIIINSWLVVTCAYISHNWL
jgi:hypothetical protein